MTRRRLLGASAIACLVAVVAVGPGGVGGPARPVTGLAAGSVLGAINVEPSARPSHYVGANPDSWWCPGPSSCSGGVDPKVRIDTELALARRLRVANIRLEIPWFLVEPARNQYDWSRADLIFQQAASFGVVINPILLFTPTWDGGPVAYPPPGDFGAFVSAFMARYGGQVGAIEMWNEPDGTGYLPVPSSSRYVQDILAPGYSAVKHSAHPNVQVILGGSINDPGTTTDPWLTGTYASGGGGDFDIAAFHDYGGNFSQTVQAYRAILNAHGQGSKPIWLGEYGISENTLNDTQQISLMDSALTTPGLAMAQFYTLRDEFVYTCCPVASTGELKYYGVVEHDDVTTKAGFGHMQALLAGQAIPPLPPPGGSSGAGSAGSAGSARRTAAPAAPIPAAAPSTTPTPSPTSLALAVPTDTPSAVPSFLAAPPNAPTNRDSGFPRGRLLLAAVLVAASGSAAVIGVRRRRSAVNSSGDVAAPGPPPPAAPPAPGPGPEA